MRRSRLAAALVSALALAASQPVVVSAQDATSLAGRWTLNRELSQFPREVGFNPDWATAPVTGGDSGATSGATGGGGGGGRTGYPMTRVSREDSMKIALLSDEVRDPAETLVITETADTVTLTPDKGLARSLHARGKDEVLQLGDVTVVATTTREAGRLVVRYRVDQAREVRYVYSRGANPAQLVVETQFLERGKGETVTRIYEPDQRSATERAAAAPRAAGASPGGPPLRPAPAQPAAPASPDRPPAQEFDQRPDAQFRGLSALGVVVEGVGPQATTCGLRTDAIQSAVAKQLASAGLKVSPNTSEDTYLYVNLQTATMAGGLCISRFDAFLYTHATAGLEYHPTPVLVDVALMHKGGLAASGAATHAESVIQGLLGYVGEITARIAAANK